MLINSRLLAMHVCARVRVCTCVCACVCVLWVFCWKVPDFAIESVWVRTVYIVVLCVCIDIVHTLVDKRGRLHTCRGIPNKVLFECLFCVYALHMCTRLPLF